MKNLQEKLNELYPTRESKEKIKEIIITGGVINFSTNLPFTDEEIKEIAGGELDLSEYSNLEKIIINGYHLKSKLTRFKVNNCAKLTTLNLSFNRLINLEINNCPKLETFYCNHNRLASSVFLNNLNPSSLISLQLGNNNFSRDLSCFAKFTNLKHLQIDSNYFSGSLEHLYDLENLELLNITDTNINLGLEYLPNSIKDFFCSPEEESFKVNSISQELEVHGEPEGYDENFANLLEKWKQANPQKIELAKDIKNAEKTLLELRIEQQQLQSQILISDAKKCIIS